MQTNFRRYILNIDRISNDSSSAVTDSNMLDITNPSPQTFAKFQWTDSDSHFHLWAFDIRTIYIYIYVYEKKILTADVSWSKILCLHSEFLFDDNVHLNVFFLHRFSSTNLAIITMFFRCCCCFSCYFEMYINNDTLFFLIQLPKEYFCSITIFIWCYRTSCRFRWTHILYILLLVIRVIKKLISTSVHTFQMWFNTIQGVSDMDANYPCTLYRSLCSCFLVFVIFCFVLLWAKWFSYSIRSRTN